MITLNSALIELMQLFFLFLKDHANQSDQSNQRAIPNQ
jgi:hypothetical protein